MSVPPEDLPRSPTGRLPQWVLDEAAGRPAPRTTWRATTDPVRRRPAPQDGGVAPWAPAAHHTGCSDVTAAHRLRARPVGPRDTLRWRVVLPVSAAAATVLLAGAAWWGGALPAAPPAWAAPPVTVPGVLPAGPSVGDAAQDAPGAPDDRAASPPSADVLALADEAFLTEQGRALFLAARPEVLDAAAFAGRCDRHTPRAAPTGAVGCFDGRTIAVYAPADPRLRGYVVETAAHETLHAAWMTLDDATRDTLTVHLEAELAALPADAPLREQLAGSVGSNLASRPTELFAYVGTQVWRTGGLAPDLEAVYARFVADRAALVAVHTGWRAVLDGLRSDVEAAQRAVAEREHAHAQRRATHDAEAAAVATYRSTYQAKAAEVAAMAPDERARLQLSWGWWDGTDLPMAPADATLARAAELLARDDAALAARAAELAAEETALLAEHIRVEALRADHDALNAQLDPTAS